MTLLIHPHVPDASGVVVEVTPESAGWTYVGFRVVKLAAGQVHRGFEHDREACLVIISGSVTIDTGAERFDRIGERSSVFDGLPTSVYVPASLAYAIEAATAAEIAICTAPGTGRGTPRVITPDQVSQETRGTGSNVRHVRNILDDRAEADSLLVVEVITPGGNWSSYPPHKHDIDNFPHETLLEETYYHRLSPPQGFAFQRVYTDDLAIDESMAVGDGDVVLVPKGYHPVAASHGYDLYYLNVMAGPRRNWVFVNDPAHDWIVRGAVKQAEAAP